MRAFSRHGWEAERAWGSNGEAMGEHREVDVKALKGDVTIRAQCKRKKALPAYLQACSEVDMTIFRQDRGPNMAVMPLELLLSLLP